MPPSADLSAASTSGTGGESALAVRLGAVIVAASGDEPKVLAVHRRASQGEAARDALPSGPLEREHRTLEAGLRSWVERQTDQQLGHVEQLYTFGDRDRSETDGAGATRALSVAYLALVREARPAADAAWESWYRYFPWEDWREGRPAVLSLIETGLRAWAAGAPDARTGIGRAERLSLAFGDRGGWDEERVLERYELLYEAGMVAEALRDRGIEAVAGREPATLPGVEMAVDHRRMLALAIGRLRGKIKYRPVVFELMPPAFTLLQLQRTVEALAGVRLHKQNFRRLVEQQRLVEETGETSAETGGRPARLVRFRREVLLERPAPGVRLPTASGRR
ncbi:NUDIX hydrolase [Ancylobacter terrae]|uniref:NUDIX hydrolase n=1 Tax=Ancylobacter sp. sgz301288 TaxID=3342077 RepID=UPI00385922DA